MESVENLKQYCDQMGVTDRYTGYRHNLNRGSRSNPGYSWLQDTGTKPTAPATARVQSSTIQQHTFKEPSRYRSAPPRPTATLRSIQERCGININFPGPTEYMDRYTGRKTNSFVQPGYIVNPLPDYAASSGRPMAIHMYERKSSEYQSRYTFPNGDTLTRFPWLRK